VIGCKIVVKNSISWELFAVPQPVHLLDGRITGGEGCGLVGGGLGHVDLMAEE